MPYPNYFNNYYGNANSNYPNQTMQPIPAQQNPLQQIQNGGFIVVKSEQEVFNFPVGCGNSVNFKLENAPYLYTKTMGFSQFDKPVIEKYKLVKEEANEVIENNSFDIRGELNRLWDEINLLKENRNEQSIKRNSTSKSNKTESDEDFIDAV